MSSKGMNEKLGLPFSKMKKVIFMFDVDGTLIDEDFNEHQMFTDLLQVLARARWKNVKIGVWSGGGKKYAEQQVRNLGLEEYVWRCFGKLEYAELKAHGYKIIAIDDIQDTAIGDVNLIVRNK